MAFTSQYIHLLCFALVIVMGHWASNASARLLDQGELLMREKHKLWMAQHERHYKDVSESEKRFQIFKENVKHIEEFNKAASGKLYTLGINAFTDLTPEEFQATHTGNKMDFPFETTKSSSETTMFRYENLTDLPSTMDWRKFGAVTPIKNQQNCGCCWAFAAVAAVEGLNQIKTKTLVSLSEQQLLDCDRNNDGCEGGLAYNAFQYILQNQGLETEDDYPYNASPGQCMATGSVAVAIDGYEAVPSDDEDALLQAVSQQPVSVSVSVDDGGNWKGYSGGIFNGGCGTELNHAVTIIGYGTDDVSGENYWLVKNSWGETWGEDGFMRILRGSNLCGIALQPCYPS